MEDELINGSLTEHEKNVEACRKHLEDLWREHPERAERPTGVYVRPEREIA